MGRRSSMLRCDESLEAVGVGFLWCLTRGRLSRSLIGFGQHSREAVLWGRAAMGDRHCVMEPGQPRMTLPEEDGTAQSPLSEQGGAGRRIKIVARPLGAAA